MDEIQYAPQLLRHIKVEIDINRKNNGQFFITGSQKFSLMEGVSDSLAGRVGILT
ncbi:MAG TPA: AAA family ATPase [Spirochaetota bacterium]|nr:AAA family ATPase [Spirochaetota bacterium]HOM09282.1 AAA family ATPase [Spirochaetota bacterium]HPP49295.1 AAA family ATPase [Spirochaetota bacterium]